MAGRATHNRAGQIVYRHISGYTYEFTVTTFTFIKSAADRDRLDISWGDSQTSTMIRHDSINLPDDYRKNTYIIRHTYPGAGTYTVLVEDPNRNFGVINIPNSVQVIFSIKTTLKIDPNLGANNAPALLTYPIDKAAIGQMFIHNPSAYDPDGDSLSYEPAICTRENGAEIESYTLPEASEYLTIDPVTGDLIWKNPVKAGIYNIAMRIKEWRRGIEIGSIVRDMQIEVVDTKNRSPVLPDLLPRCVEAGTTIDFMVNATDPDRDNILLTATGGPFQVNTGKAAFTPVSAAAGSAVSRFTWHTDNNHVRKQPYTVTIKAEDQNMEVKLVSFANLNITVLAPKINNLATVAEKKSIRLTWDATPCTHAAGYEIYRSIGPNPVEPDTCTGGIPPDSGYEKIADIKGIGNTSYDDTNNGRGLSPGIEYCYRVVAYFADGAKSFPSDEACAVLLSGTPPMILADVETVDVAGAVRVAWLRKPLDNLIAAGTGPFEYLLYHTEDTTANWTLLKQTNDLTDTTFIHAPVDTKTRYPHYYKVELKDNGVTIEENETASTLYPKLVPSDQSVIITFERYTPWVNTTYTIYRCEKTGTDMCDPAVLAGVSTKETYTDTGLKNGQEYCYRVVSKGYRMIDGIVYENENRSHIACVTPFDNVPPCAPELTGKSVCGENRNQLDWIYNKSCMADVEKYRIYYSPDNKSYEKTDSVMSRDMHTYSHNGVLVGCYYITAVDTAGNVSPASNAVCLDECGSYELPNVFTPNGDNMNDIFKSNNPGGVRKVDMKIFNRWGKLVFQTADPAVNWDGRDVDSKRFAPTGIYYYTCDVYEERLTGSQIKTLAGFIHLYYGKDAQPFNE
jgi:gliding motility-associated-like protein